MLRSPTLMLACAVLLGSLGLGCTRERKPPLDRPHATEADEASRHLPDASSLVYAASESFLLRSWSFETSATSLTIDDLGMSRSLVDALGPDGRVAINGGFFDVEGRPVGLAVSAGEVLSKYAAKLSGGVFYTVDGVAHLEATEAFDAHTRVTFAVQCRPRLVVRGQANVKRDDGQRAERTALCIRNDGRTVDAIVAEPANGTRGPSVYALGQYLAEQRHCDDALNLDGGPSTGAAYREAKADASAAPTVLPPRGPLRHAIVFR